MARFRLEPDEDRGFVRSIISFNVMADESPIRRFITGRCTIADDTGKRNSSLAEKVNPIIALRYGGKRDSLSFRFRKKECISAL